MSNPTDPKGPPHTSPVILEAFSNPTPEAPAPADPGVELKENTPAIEPAASPDSASPPPERRSGLTKVGPNPEAADKVLALLRDVPTIPQYASIYGPPLAGDDD